MSLLDQSQQWFPTSVQVTVHQARNLRVKGKNGTNDAYAIIQVAKDKFSTSVAEKCVAPVWKEEASFDLPLFHPGNAERCTLYIIVNHRAQVGLDKFLGQAVINLLDLHDNKSRKKTDWFKLVDKTGKEDKVRGEVLLDIQFMRNNMSASMFDLSMDKPRSRISKLKDKVRGKKKDGFSDSASAIVPSVSQVLSDSEGEADAQSLSHSPGTKKKSKFKTLFAPKSNLQRNISQSMSTLGTLPEKNSSLSGSRSSGLNVDSPEGKRKFKFLGHKRTGSSDSKVSQGAFSLLGRSKQSNSDLNNLCINGSHVYAEEAEAKSGSTLSLNSSGRGSVEDVRKHTSHASADSSTDRALMEQQRHQEEEKRRQAEESRMAETRRLEEEERYRMEAKRLQEEEQRRQQEEQERRRRVLEDEARRKKREEEEEAERRKKMEELSMLEAAENQRLEEERRRAEEQKRQEEASMTDRLSTLFGMIRKKEEKKEEVQPKTQEEQAPTPAPQSYSRGSDQPSPHHSSNPFGDSPFSSEPPTATNKFPGDDQKFSRNPQTPSATVFLNRTAKVSAVKPRSAQTLDCEAADCQSPGQLSPSPATSDSTTSSLSPEPLNIFSSLHSSLAPPNKSPSVSSSPRGSMENLSSVGSDKSLPTMADQKRRALLPPSYPVGNQSRGNQAPVREIKNPAYVEADGTQKEKLSIPLPDYESLFPQKRHGVMGQSRWDHIIAEVNQRNRDLPPERLGPEMSVDTPEERQPSPRSSITPETPAVRKNQDTRPVSSKKVAAPAPPKPVATPLHRPGVDSSERRSQSITPQPVTRPNASAVSAPGKTDTSGGRMPVGDINPRQPSPVPAPVPRSSSQMGFDTAQSDDERKVRGALNKEGPTAKPRQRALGKESQQQEEAAVNGNVQADPSASSGVKKAKESFADFDSIPSSARLAKDGRLLQKQNQKVDLFTGNLQKELIAEDLGMTADDMDQIFSQNKTPDPFASFNGYDSDRQSDSRKEDEYSKQASPAFQRKNSQKGKKLLSSTSHSDGTTFKSQREASHREAPTSATANQGSSARDVTNSSVTLQPEAEAKTHNSLYAGEDPFGAEPFHVPPASSLPVVMEEPSSQTGNLSGGKTLLRAWVSPSEGQPISAQNSSGGGLAFTPRRPHPVKPMSSSESQHHISSPAVKDTKGRASTPGKIQVVDSAASGPYSQLTQEELITLVVKQQADLSRKDAKIGELEEYIDNLLVRVIEEKPTILYALNSAKQV